MIIHHDIDNLPFFKNAVVTTGTFDGVHQGHLQLLHTITAFARLHAGETVLITFDPHPRLVLQPTDQTLKLLTTKAEKSRLLAETGLNHLVFVPFNTDFAALSAVDYIQQFLVNKFKPKAIALGYNHNFGHHRDGNIELLRKYSASGSYEVIEISKQIVEDIDVSSTRIRVALTEGDLETANRLLGHPYTLEGKIVKGKQLGRQLGFPTANLDIADIHKLVPAFGVYAVKAQLGDKNLYGVMNIGNRPTVDGTHRSIEVHLFNFSGDIYSQTLHVELIHYLRGEQKFDGLDALKTQIALDKKRAMMLLGLSEQSF